MKTKTINLLLMAVLCISTAWSQETILNDNGSKTTWNQNGSVTVSDGEHKFSTRVANNMEEAFEIMHRMNFALPFLATKDGSEAFTNTGYIDLSNRGIEGSAELSIFHYDENATDYKGKLVYGVRATRNGQRNEHWIHNIGPGNWFGTINAKSTNTKKLLSATNIITNNPNCVESFNSRHGAGWGIAAAGVFVVGSILAAPFTEGASLTYLPEAVLVNGTMGSVAAAGGVAIVGGTYIATSDNEDGFFFNSFPPECFKDMVLQPVIIELKVKNATINSFRMPGPDTDFDILTPRNIFTSPIEHQDVVINNGTNQAIFKNSSDTQVEDSELTVRGDVLITDMDEKDNLLGLVGSDNWQLYVGSIEVDGTDENGKPKRAAGIVSENFILRAKEDFLLPDFVFEPDYTKPSLAQLEDYIKTNKHLPNVSSQKDVDKDGYYSVPGMFMGQLQNLEELYLHAFDQETKIKQQIQNSLTFRDRLESIEKIIQKLEKQQDHE